MLALLKNRGRYINTNMVGVDYSPGSVELARKLQRFKLHSAYRYTDQDDDDYDDDDQDENENEKKEEEEEEEEDVDDNPIRFEEWDILSSKNKNALSKSQLQLPSSSYIKLDWFPYDKGGFDLVLDKGTFDAVSLSEEMEEEEDVQEKEGGTTASTTRRRICERYPYIAKQLVRKGGFLVVTSCNWTEEELIQWFTTPDPDDGGGLSVWGRVEYPRFTFGGRQGQGVCTLCFQRL